MFFQQAKDNTKKKTAQNFLSFHAISKTHNSVLNTLQI